MIGPKTSRCVVAAIAASGSNSREIGAARIPVRGGTPPLHILFSYFCEGGVGGYSGLESGRKWYSVRWTNRVFMSTV